MTTTPWDGDTGVVTLPNGARVRGGRLHAEGTPADVALVLAAGPTPPWTGRHRRADGDAPARAGAAPG